MIAKQMANSEITVEHEPNDYGEVYLDEGDSVIYDDYPDEEIIVDHSSVEEIYVEHDVDDVIYEDVPVEEVYVDHDVDDVILDDSIDGSADNSADTSVGQDLSNSEEENLEDADGWEEYIEEEFGDSSDESEELDKLNESDK